MANLQVDDLPLIPAVDNADLYAAKSNLDYRVRTGEPNGVATLNGSGQVPASQIDINTILADAVRKSVGGIQVLNSALASPTGYAVRSARDGGVKVSVQDVTGATTYGGITNDASGVGFQNSVSSKRFIIRDDGFSRLNGPMAFFDGNFGTEVGLVQMGWNNNIRLWQQGILASGNYVMYGFDAAGANQTLQYTAQRGISNNFTGFVAGSGGLDVMALAAVQGGQIRWNVAAAGLGRTEFINNRGGGSGGFSWYDRADTSAVPGTAIMTLVASGATAVNFTATSDATLKKDITDRVARTRLPDMLRFVEYIWKDSGDKGLGLIAQEVRAVAPEYVHEGRDGILSIDKAGIALECVIGLAARVAELEEKLG